MTSTCIRLTHRRGRRSPPPTTTLAVSVREVKPTTILQWSHTHARTCTPHTHTFTRAYITKKERHALVLRIDLNISTRAFALDTDFSVAVVFRKYSYTSSTATVYVCNNYCYCVRANRCMFSTDDRNLNDLVRTDYMWNIVTIRL